MLFICRRGGGLGGHLGVSIGLLTAAAAVQLNDAVTPPTVCKFEMWKPGAGGGGGVKVQLVKI